MKCCCCWRKRRRRRWLKGGEEVPLESSHTAEEFDWALLGHLNLIPSIPSSLSYCTLKYNNIRFNCLLSEWVMIFRFPDVHHHSIQPPATAAPVGRRGGGGCVFPSRSEKKKIFYFPKGVYTCHGHIDAALGVQSSARTRRRRQPASGNLKGTGDFYFIFIVFNWDTTSCVRDATKTTTTTNVR